MPNYTYPRIVQLMPADNIWIKYNETETGDFFYCKATCLALVENLNPDLGLETYVEYIDMDSSGFYDLSDPYSNAGGRTSEIIYSTQDLSRESGICPNCKGRGTPGKKHLCPVFLQEIFGSSMQTNCCEVEHD